MGHDGNNAPCHSRKVNLDHHIYWLSRKLFNTPAVFEQFDQLLLATCTCVDMHISSVRNQLIFLDCRYQILLFIGRCIAHIPFQRPHHLGIPQVTCAIGIPFSLFGQFDPLVNVPLVNKFNIFLRIGITNIDM